MALGGGRGGFKIVNRQYLLLNITGEKYHNYKKNIFSLAHETILAFEQLFFKLAFLKHFGTKISCLLKSAQNL